MMNGLSAKTGSMRTAALALFCAFATVLFGTAARADSPPRDAIVTTARTFEAYDFKIINSGWEGLADGAKIHVRMYRPLTGTGPFPAVVFVPPPQQSSILGGTDRWSAFAGRRMTAAEKLAELGIAAVLYNPPGRGAGAFASSGDDGRGGFMSQDALAQVVRDAARMDFITAANIGLVSEGAGLCDASGALARHSDLGVRYLIDFEGQWDNLELTGFQWKHVAPEAGREQVTRTELYWQHLPTSLDKSDETAEWWGRREPRTYMRSMPLKIYQRVQFSIDATQPPDYFAHALSAYQAALDSQIPHVRFNNAVWDASLPVRRVPAPLPGKLEDNYVENISMWVAALAALDDAALPARQLPPEHPPSPLPLPRPFSLY